MATLALPLVISFLKPHSTHFSLLRPGKPNPNRLYNAPLSNRLFYRTSAVSTSAGPSTGSNSETQKASVLTFQQAIQRLQEYWASVGCAVMQCSNTEVIYGDFCWGWDNESTDISKGSWSGTMECRVSMLWNVILKPDPGNSQDLFIRSLSALAFVLCFTSTPGLSHLLFICLIGIDVGKHDIRFVEDNWESPVLYYLMLSLVHGVWAGKSGWMGMEITQFTYFQQAGSLQLSPISVEITYGLERILMLLQGVDHFKKIQYANGITYGELFLENEKEMSAYYLEHASVLHLQKHFDFFEEEARSLIASGLPIPAYDQLLKTSHAFNILDSRGFVGVTERARYFGRMRSLARQCAQLWLKTRESLGHPLGIVSEPVNLICPKQYLEAAVEKVHDNPRSFVLEIGTEEMPPQDVVNASEQVLLFL
ncbi:hypothetical protein Patl1_00102 [Pistacia atlantica]|uniref:Uncharacterized protein n=1 Tax=Pistacia atlantica TaxID=434234 RepID=A0ACC1CA40_9ROSI|nr:hypothetical protein Patl1_00102 [Pistacia atlantica]